MAAFHAGSQFVIAIFYFCSSSEDSAATPSIRMDKSGLWRFIGRSSHIFRCRSIRAVGITSVSGGHFGGSKLLAEFCAKPLLHYTLQATSGLFADRVVVTRSAEAAHFAQSCGVRTVLHTLPVRSDAVRPGVQALKPGLAGAVFCPADQPCLSPETLLALAAAAQSVPECLWRTAFGGQVGAPAAFSRTFFAELCCLPAGQGGGAVLKARPQLVRCVQAQRAEELLDIDTKEDLETLQRRILNE